MCYYPISGISYLFIGLIMIIAVILILVSILALFLIQMNFTLQKKLSAVQSRISEFEQKYMLDQHEFIQKLSQKYKDLYNEAIEQAKKDKLKIDDFTGIFLSKAISDFEAKIKQEFNIACENIRFDEIEYKKTITKKRKEYNRKHGKDANPQRIWRYIDEE